MAAPTASTQPGPRPLGEQDLVARAREWDAAALREIMERNNGRLYRLARSVLRNDSDAEDVLQDTYLKAFQHLASFRGDASISTWLTRIALNEALGRLRRNRRAAGLSRTGQEPPDPTAEVIPFPTTSDDPEKIMGRKEIAGLLERAIDSLPDAFRIVFVMRTIEEMSVEETARCLGIPEATVKTRQHRARRLLRQSVEAEIGSALTDTFPFAGRRCARITESVLSRLGLPSGT